MNFTLNNKQVNLKDSVRRFCEREFDSDYALELDRKETFPIELYRKAASHRFSSQFIPKEYGGGGQGYLESGLVMEEMCRADSSLGLACMIGTFGSEMLLLYGTEEQKKRYLPPVCCGDKIFAAAFSEPKHGTDISLLDTLALKAGDKWVINGTKIFITNAPIADFIIVLCQTGSTAKPRMSQSLFIVDSEAEGLTIKKMSNKMGIRCITLGEISLKNVKVNKNSLIGDRDNGYNHSMDFFTVSRIAIAFQAIGTAQGAFEIAIRYAKKRVTAGQPIIRFQQIGAKLAQIASEIEAAKLLIYKAAWSIDQNRANPMLTSMAKLYSSHIAVKATDAAIQTLGGYGYFSNYKVERAYRDVKVTEIYEGTSEIQRLSILRHLIKSY